MRTRSLLLFVVLIYATSAQTTFADVINFESIIGPTTFNAAGNAQTVIISTGIGSVTVQGGVVLTAATNLPANQTSIYGTAGNATDIGVPTGSGFTNPITITFPVPISNFFLDVLNGNIVDVNYQVADNNGNSANALLSPSLSGGLKTIGFAATGSVVTISATTGQPTWDFFIDNIHFNETLPPDIATVPEPSTLTLTGMCLGGFILSAFARRRYTKGNGL